jgi:chloride channel protein, CIC family
MSLPEQAAVARADREGGLLALAGVALLVGSLAGLLGTAFIFALKYAAREFGVLLDWAHGKSAGFLIFALLCALMTALAARWVRRYSTYASGSGIPHVESVLTEELPPAPVGLVPVKFIGGTLAITAGLALGREGPCVQMGAATGLQIGRLFRRSWPDCLVLFAAGAGAGLATAFNAPIAGAVFVLEELMRRFDTRTTIATFAASAGAIGLSRIFLGQGPLFSIVQAPYPDFGTMPMYLGLGVIAGVVGVLYNHALLGALAGVDKLRGWAAALFPAAVGALVGVIAWFHPGIVGGGDGITQRTLLNAGTLSFVSGLFVIRFALGSLSYAARTPGGLFAPMLVLGAQSGWLYATVCGRMFPAMAVDPALFAVVGMAAFFTAVVRAPLTGIILIIEMTNGFTLLLPMLTACFTAMLLPTVFGDEPIYESLRKRLLSQHPHEAPHRRSGA